MMIKPQYVIGYTTGVFDLFHIGHLNLLKNAKEQCDYLIVGVTIDDLVSYKGKQAFIPFEERIEIVKAIKYVDKVVPQTDLDKVKAWDLFHYDVLFVGDDWKGTHNWINYERQLMEKDVKVIYLPYTRTTSSTAIREKILLFNNEVNP